MRATLILRIDRYLVDGLPVPAEDFWQAWRQAHERASFERKVLSSERLDAGEDVIADYHTFRIVYAVKGGRP